MDSPCRWWSSQHLLFTVSLIIFFWREGVHRALPYPYLGRAIKNKESPSRSTPKRPRKSDNITIGAPNTPSSTATDHTPFVMWFANTFTFVVLGFIGAISTTFALFLIQHNPNLNAYTPKIKDVRPDAILNTMILASIVSIGITPWVTPGTVYFSWNLRL